MGKPAIPAEAFDHGDPRRYRRGCRCRRCTVGVTAEVRKARYLRKTGRGSMTTPDKAANRIARLRALGMQDGEICKAASVGADALYRIMKRERPILRRTEARILAVAPPQGEVLGSGALTSGLGTVRRLRALAADGFTATALGSRAGKHKQFIVYLQNSKLDAQVRLWVSDYVRDLYADLDGLAPEGAGVAPHIAKRTRLLAAKKGWVGRGYWDAEDFDNPDFVPAAVAAPRYIVLSEDCLELESLGHTRQQIAERFGITKNHLDTALSRYRKTGRLARAA